MYTCGEVEEKREGGKGGAEKGEHQRGKHKGKQIKMSLSTNIENRERGISKGDELKIFFFPSHFDNLFYPLKSHV